MLDISQKNSFWHLILTASPVNFLGYDKLGNNLFPYHLKLPKNVRKVLGGIENVV